MSGLGSFDWAYLMLVNGRLVKAETIDEANTGWPSFANIDEAEKYLKEHDIRATVIPSIEGFEGEKITLPKQIKKEGEKSGQK